MNKSNNKKGLFSRFILIFLPLFLLFSPPVSAGDNPSEKLRGPAFTDPSRTQDMSSAWIKQPVKHGPAADKVDLVITLDQHLYEPFKPLIRKYAAAHNMKIFINEGTCGISAGMLSRKTADIGGYCCSPGITDRLPGLRFHTVGIDAIALLVHPDNPVENVTLEEAQGIFMGDIYRWSELKAPDGRKGQNLPVQPVGRLHCKLRPGHWRLLLDNEDLFSPGLQEVGAIPDMISQVASNPRAIGYEVLWNPVRYKEKGEVKVLRIDGYSPRKKEDLLSGRYPLYRTYSFTTWEGEGLENPEAKKLVNYLIKQAENFGPEHNIIPVSRLKEANWKFKDSELIGEPE